MTVTSSIASLFRSKATAALLTTTGVANCVPTTLAWALIAARPVSLKALAVSTARERMFMCLPSFGWASPYATSMRVATKRCIAKALDPRATKCKRPHVPTAIDVR